MNLKRFTPVYIYRGLKLRFLKKFGTPKSLADYLYFRAFQRRINWNHPEDLNQWINWLSFNTDTTEWSRLADKCAVREYIMACGLGDLLVPLIKVWDRPEEISFDNLPDSFVLKANNGSGDIRIITNKNTSNIEEVRRYFKTLFTNPFGRDSAEPHYLRIKPRILAEELLDKSKQSVLSTSLIDYKIWCINGEPQFFFLVSNRSGHCAEISTYDTDWRPLKGILVYSDHYKQPQLEIPKPENLESMLSAARKLSKPFPQVRIDFYEVDNKVYFGEMTFTSAAGRMGYFSDNILKTLGNKIDSNQRVCRLLRFKPTVSL